jgi:hypothetical protein
MGDQATELPLACSLSGEEIRDRAARWELLSRSALLESSRNEHGAVLRFRDAPEVQRELAELVGLERECCPFLRLDLRAEGEALLLEVSGPPEAGAMIDHFAAVRPPSAVSRSC